MPDEPHLFAHITAADGQADALRAILTELANHSRQEPGIIHYLVHEAGPGDFYFYEVYQDKAAFEAHIATPHVQTASAKMRPLLAKPPHMVQTRRIAGR